MIQIDPLKVLSRKDTKDTWPAGSDRPAPRARTGSDSSRDPSAAHRLFHDAVEEAANVAMVILGVAMSGQTTHTNLLKSPLTFLYSRLSN